MKTWYIGTNDWYEYGSYDLVEAPWYVFFVEWLAFRLDDLISFFFGSSKIWELWWIHGFNKIFDWCSKRETMTCIFREWSKLIRDHPERMKEEIIKAEQYSQERWSDPDFDWKDWNDRRKVFIEELQK